jgi:DNA polymerase
MEIEKMSLDYESFSDQDIRKCGAYRYWESPASRILLMGVSVNDGPVVQYDFTRGDLPPDDILRALADPKVEKWAFNASFERIASSTWLRRHRPDIFKGYGPPGDSTGNYLDPEGWKCSMVWSAYLGLPLSLDAVGKALHLTEQKMTEGRDLIRFFCIPCRPTKTNGYRTVNRPEDAPEKWSTFCAYNIRDVVTEMGVKDRLKKYPVPDSVWDEYHMSERINDRGVLIDKKLVDSAIILDDQSQQDLMGQMREITGLANPNSPVQLLSWLKEHGCPADSLGKKQVAELLKTAQGEVKDVLLLRQQAAKTSVKKYIAMKSAACSDGRIRGMTQFYGANRSGRFSGRIVQLQNLYRNSMPDLAEARSLVKTGDYEAVNIIYDSVPQVLSELIRTALIPKPGMKFVVADYSSVEARCLAFLAGEQHTIDAFARGEDLYCATASAMFHKPVVKHGVNSELRQRGKIATLACGYGGATGALISMGAREMGLKDDELQPIVDAWRRANPHIVRFWHDVDLAAKTAVRERRTTSVRGIRFICESGMLFIELPSGRRLSYVKPRLGINRFGSESITYMNVGQTKKWERTETFGGKLVENITQAVCRDILCYAMNTLKDVQIVAHVHDEIIAECPMDASVDAICEKMGRTPPWIPGLLLRADGYECEFYMKD